MNPPPFELDVLLPGAGEAADLNIELRAEPEEEPIEADEYQGTLEVVELFCQGVREQFFSRGRGRPIGAHLALSARDWDPLLPGWRLRAGAGSVPPEAFLVLLGLLTQTHHALEPLQQVRLRAATRPARPLDRDGLLALPRAVPARIEALPFRVEDVLGGIENLRVAFEFETPLSRAAYRQVCESLNVWDHLVMLGGFNLDFEEVNELEQLGETTREGPRIVSHALEDFSADECAFDALVNLGARLHAEGHRLEALVID